MTVCLNVLAGSQTVMPTYEEKVPAPFIEYCTIDLLLMLSLKMHCILFDGLYDPGKAIGIYPWSDVGKELPRTGFDRLIGGISELKGVRGPLTMNLFYRIFHRFFHSSV